MSVLATGESVPTSYRVVHFHLSDWLPLEIGTHRIHLALINRDTAIFNEGGLCVIEL